MKAYRKFSTAKRYTKPGGRIIRVGDLYIVGDFKTYDTIAVLDDTGLYLGNVAVMHLERLGNANWAIKGEV